MQSRYIEISIIPSLIKVNIDKIADISAIAENISENPRKERMLNFLRSATKSKWIIVLSNSEYKEIIKGLIEFVKRYDLSEVIRGLELHSHRLKFFLLLLLPRFLHMHCRFSGLLQVAT